MFRQEVPLYLTGNSLSPMTMVTPWVKTVDCYEGPCEATGPGECTTNGCPGLLVLVYKHALYYGYVPLDRRLKVHTKILCSFVLDLTFEP